MSKAYYNEFDSGAAAWLRELIRMGAIADGDVDERSIEDVYPSDLRGYTQCHFFAGIGGWSYALRLAGWPDDRPVWTGSCPCQPFSSAGKGSAFADERHLWPAFFHLIGECRPAVVIGEQVASKDADAWIDLIQADMEGLDYAFGAVPFPSAGVGAPHLRDRLYWVGDAAGFRRNEQRGAQGVALQGQCAERGGEHAKSRRAGELSRGLEGLGGTRLLDDDDEGLEGQRRGHQAESGRQGAARPVAEAGEFGGVADARINGRYQAGECVATAGGNGLIGNGANGELDNAIGHGRRAWRNNDAEHDGQQFDAACHADRPGPTNGFWRDADWLFCRDGRWRPVEPGTFPLVDGLPKGMVPSSRIGMAIDANKTAEARVMRLRGYGNAINPIQAALFVESFMDSMK